VLLAVLARSAQAEPAVYRPAATKAKTATFRVVGVKPKTVRAAKLRAGRHSQRVRLAAVRRALPNHRVVTRLPKRMRKPRVRRKLKLTLHLAKAKSARNRARGDNAASGLSGSCSFGSFSVDNWPGGCWRPFSAASPFNQPVAANARVHPNSSAIVQRMVSLYGGPGKMTAGDADTSDDYSHPLYYPSSSDPVFTLHCFEAWGTCPIEGHNVRIPDAARPAAGGDGHMGVIDQTTGWEYDLYEVRSKPAGGGILELGWGGRTRLDGDGLGSNATAAHFALSAGVIRAQELAAGKINHALFMVVKCTAGTVYPAAGGGSQCADTANAPAGGMRMQLTYSEAEINALAVPAWKKTILHALREYGALVGDTGGSGYNFQFESGSTYTSFGRSDKLVDWAKNQPGVAAYNGKHVFDLAASVDWSRMRVIDPA
jgi:hypothetical protein